MAISAFDKRIPDPAANGFISAPPPADEAARLRALQRYDVLDSDPDLRFDRVTALTKRLMGTHTALISLVDADRQFFLSRQGLEARETPRQMAFCAHAILADDILEVPDAAQDPRFSGNPLVVGPPYIRYYVGKPLRTPDGYRIGTLCAIDAVPHDPIDVDRRQILAELSEMAMDLIETRVWALEADSERLLLRRAAALKEDYLAAMAHELRTPVNALAGFGELLQISGASDILSESQSGYLNSLVEAAEYMRLLVNETLEAHTPAASVAGLPPDAALLAPILKAVARMIAPLARKQGVTLTVDCGEDIIVWAEPLRLRKVFINLLSNAVKYNEHEGSVAVRVVAADPDCVAILVQDTGKGIPDEDIPRLFSAFHRGAATAHSVEGTGLGLHITDRLVRMMGGRMSVESTLGQGTTFTVILGRAVVPPPA